MGEAKRRKAKDSSFGRKEASIVLTDQTAPELIEIEKILKQKYHTIERGLIYYKNTEHYCLIHPFIKEGKMYSEFVIASNSKKQISQKIIDYLSQIATKLIIEQADIVFLETKQ